ncbi:unnamed protein product [Bursaphelenchus okinawaensis]|uniref:Uncharacterized protein n=1 Tax=Bursaphelenchus okinawaensis TaxID=465554 RepID=A0A811L645_9BILA|nr:unnamed protein product [Bursaphelenchus okinawaensis]CAG9117341.1 unnamed protein product [Bursaphelenchus okinawaensis]
MKVCIVVVLAFTVALADLDNLFDHNKLEDWFKNNKIADFVNKLDNVTDETRKTLHLTPNLYKKVAGNDEEKKHFHDFFDFIAKHNKSYESETDLSERFEKFKKSAERIAKHQKENPEAEFGHTQFSDLSPEEFIAKHTGLSTKDLKKKPKNARSKRASIPSAWDWRSHNGVTAIRNQGQCGCCYAFAATSAIESQMKIQKNETYNLSQQQAVSCTYNVAKYGDNNGCSGGQSSGVFQLAIDSGLGKQADFTYTSGSTLKVPACKSITTAVKVSSWEQLPSDDEETMAETVYNQGPIVIYIDADQMMNYKNGIMNPTAPSGGWSINHAVLLVGYGVQNSTSTPYWIIQNSWGTSWGLKGFVLVKRGVNSMDLAQYVYSVK